jgi:rhodanese-related sulfurtransferase
MMRKLQLTIVAVLFTTLGLMAQELKPVKFFKQDLDSNSKIQLLDVRTDAEFSEHRLENAFLIDFYLEDFVKRCEESLSKKRTVYLYCRSGGRSNMAAQKLQKAGFKTVDMKGGIKAWLAAEYPVVSGSD